jgi:actin-binding LIM protein
MKSSSSEDENEVEEVQQDTSEEEEEVPDPKLDQTENELKKISTGMASVFLVDLEKERIRRKSEKSTKFIDPRSAARTPAANRCPPFRLRYDSPVNASPSRIADHLNPWEDDVEGIRSRRSFFSATPFLPSTPGLVGGRISTTSPKGRKSSTLPSRNSPAHPGGGPLTYSTDFSTDISDGEGGKDSTGTPMVKPVRVSSAYAPTPESHMNGTHGTNGGGSLPNMPPSSLAATDDEGDMNGEEEYEYIPQASNVYPLHLLMTTNYRLPGDVDRCNLERHLTDAEFDSVFKCLRDEFYRLPYWKRCDLKRRIFLF